MADSERYTHMRDRQAFAPEPEAKRPEWSKAKRKLDRISNRIGCAEPDRMLTPEDWSPVVYAWMRGDACLYVGMSTRGLMRVFAINHHVITGLEPTDTVFIWHLEDAQSAARLEQALIDRLRPSLNRAGNPEPLPMPESLR